MLYLQDEPSVASHFKSNKASLAEVVAELAAVDRLPFQIIAESHRINAAFRAQGYQIPKDRKAVKGLVIDFFEKVADETKKELAEMKKGNWRFSLSLDEYTSLKNKRFAMT